MARGRDGIHNPKISASTFLLSPEMHSVRSSFVKGPKGTVDPALPQIGENKGLADATRNALSNYLSGTRAPDIEERFGKGSAKWLQNNLDTFSPDEWLHLYYMLEKVPRRPIADNLPADTGQTFRKPSNITGRRG